MVRLRVWRARVMCVVYDVWCMVVAVLMTVPTRIVVTLVVVVTIMIMLCQ